MDTILIVGSETVVGANLAAHWADRYRIIALSSNRSISIAGCESAVCRNHDEESVREWIASEQPRWIIYCGAAAQSNWERSELGLAHDESALPAENWAKVSAEFARPSTFISSDAVFTGPWMFHAEDCTSLCESRPAAMIRAVENRVAELCPAALIVRTNAFGWSPQAAGTGWIERTLAQLEAATPRFDGVRHATPILATDFADVLELALQQGLSGVYHIGGAERINPARFVQRLADRFGFTDACIEETWSADATERPTGFGRGETSLRTQKIRRALGVSMPLIEDGLERLFRQQYDGYLDRLNGTAAQICERVA